VEEGGAEENARNEAGEKEKDHIICLPTVKSR
jgi:hypothetical protein